MANEANQLIRNDDAMMQFQQNKKLESNIEANRKKKKKKHNKAAATRALWIQPQKAAA